ncbi:CDP-alcohol phosphatidyltransferase family protein [Neisseria sp. Ec49-e6-T10]|uniref:CDP-alcohol phosphatidyltransferase family protein n=1 Tax=Neisseria sp. Ec49-e6-T10 TaxID=3140744 RepID=UPI003EBCA176
MTLYDIKPKFQDLLRPIVKKLYSKGITANQVTLAALIGSIGIGVLLIIFPYPHLFIILPIYLFFRMALNAIDGMLAREFYQQSNLGALLNELGDVLSDLFLYLPFLFLSQASIVFILIALFLMFLTEFCGVLVQTIGASRRYDGPLGKSDRALILGTYGLLLAVWPASVQFLTVIFICIALLCLYTCFNRCQKGLKQISTQ